MATKTAQDVITHALRKMNVIAAGEEADADTYQTALDEYGVFHEWLMRDNERVYKATRGRWDSNAVPSEIWTNVAGAFAGELIGTFPVSDTKAAKVVAASETAKSRIREWLQRRRNVDRFDPMLAADQNLYNGSVRRV